MTIKEEQAISADSGEQADPITQKMKPRQDIAADKQQKDVNDKRTEDGKTAQEEVLAQKAGLNFKRVLSKEGVGPLDSVNWVKIDAIIANEKGETMFSQTNVEVPSTWSQMATNIVASKYFRGAMGSDIRETSVKQLVSRVVDTITGWGIDGGYFDRETAAVFEDELKAILINQIAAFNSPVWFNCGIEPKPQCSACFINSVTDTMESILKLAVTEGMLFKYGSGAGVNLSPIRSSREILTTGGIASGPVSFMKGYDAFAGVIKSGGRTRRAAKMVVLNTDHPDILDFIRSKSEEEKKAWALIDAGYDGSFNGVAYSSVFFQNANHSIRATDEFMRAVINDKDWSTRSIMGQEIMDTYKARFLMEEISKSAHMCGDPGMQFDSTINDWHTCPNSGRINASNPCSEFMFLDNSACNLASINLLKFKMADGSFDTDTFTHVVEIMIMAQEIIVENAGYPTKEITKNSLDYRPLGLGYANLGALLMSKGFPYDSDEGRDYAGAITALMTGHAYKTSAQISSHMGPFKYFMKNKEPFLRVIDKHRIHAYRISSKRIEDKLLMAARKAWDDAHNMCMNFGMRNSQVSVLAPTGTIGFMMDCDTTGVEPELALVKYKKLVGGGVIKIVNKTVPESLTLLGYDEKQIEEILSYIDQKDTIEGAPNLKDEHLSVFDCSFRPANGSRSIHYMGHVRMMAAVQPFISGAISKTVNMSHETTEAEIMDAYIESWKMGLKAIAIYRDGCKRTQPLVTTLVGKDGKRKPTRRRLPDERQAITHKFRVGQNEGYITVGLYEDGMPGEIFLTMAKEGSVISGLMDSFATAISLALQYGVPLRVLTEKFSHMRFEPSGMTNNPNIRIAKSLVDYIFRWMALKFLPEEDQIRFGLNVVKKAGEDDTDKKFITTTITPEDQTRLDDGSKWGALLQEDAPPCMDCGSIMVRSGTCYRCPNCGSTSGCS